MPTDPHVPTLAEVVHRATEIVDPSGRDDGVSQLLARFEDRDEPITAIADPEQVIYEGKGAIDPQDDEPPVTMAAAAAVYLAHRRDEMPDSPDEVLRLAARAEFDGHPPENVAAWLAERGIHV